MLRRWIYSKRSPPLSSWGESFERASPRIFAQDESAIRNEKYIDIDIDIDMLRHAIQPSGGGCGEDRWLQGLLGHMQ